MDVPQFQKLSKSAAKGLAIAIEPGATKIVGSCPYEAVFGQMLDLGVNSKITAANLDVNTPQTGGVDIVCETANAQIAVGTYVPTVLTTDLLAEQATSVTPTPYGSIYVFPKYLFQQPDKYVQYAWLLTDELFVGIAVPPPMTEQPLIDRLTALAPTLVTLSVAVSATGIR